MIRRLALVTVALSFQGLGLAHRSAMQEEKSAKELVARLYAVPPENFELGEFAGKPNPEKQRNLLGQFLEPELIIRNKNDGFYATGDGNFFRFPQADSEELSPKTRPHGEQWRIYKIRTFEHWPLDAEELQRLEGVTQFPPSDSFTSLTPW